MIKVYFFLLQFIYVFFALLISFCGIVVLLTGFMVNPLGALFLFAGLYLLREVRKFKVFLCLDSVGRNFKVFVSVVSVLFFIYFVIRPFVIDQEYRWAFWQKASVFSILLPLFAIIYLVIKKIRKTVYKNKIQSG